MGSTKGFRALSLDLGETVWWATPLQATRQAEARNRSLAEMLIGPAGRRPDVAEIEAAERADRVELDATRRGYATISTEHRLAGIARRLDARLSLPLGQAVSRFAFAGLDSDPPTVNPQARQLVRSVNQHGLPVVAISNTQRTGEAWSRFLESEGLTFRFVITSSDYEAAKPDSRLFRAAAEGLGIPAVEILHVGDRWATDVLGALSVGMGAALYRGLWSRYWDFEEGPPADPGGHPEIPRWDDLIHAEGLLVDRSNG